VIGGERGNQLLPQRLLDAAEIFRFDRCQQCPLQR
jgi:hypothetical protein